MAIRTKLNPLGGTAKPYKVGATVFETATVGTHMLKWMKVEKLRFPL